MMLSPRIGVVAALVAVALLLASTLGSVAQFWLEMPDYAHGWLILAVAIGWCARVLWRHPLPVPDSGALLRALPLGCALFMWLVATNAHSKIGAQLLLPVVLLAAPCMRVAHSWENPCMACNRSMFCFQSALRPTLARLSNL